MAPPRNKNSRKRKLPPKKALDPRSSERPAKSGRTSQDGAAAAMAPLASAAALAPELDFEEMPDDVEPEDHVIGSELDVVEEGDEDNDDDIAPTKPVWRPENGLQDGETLEYESSAYNVFHRLNVPSSSLSIAPILDPLGAVRTKPPFDCCVAIGSSIPAPHKNQVLLFRASDLHKTRHDDMDPEDPDYDSDGDPDDLDDDPTVNHSEFFHPGEVMRVRTSPLFPQYIATSGDVDGRGRIFVWDVTTNLTALYPERGPWATLGPLSDPKKVKKGPKPSPAPVYRFDSHLAPAWALAWHPFRPLELLSGDDTGCIWLHMQKGNQMQAVRSFRGHKGAVQDVAWCRVADPSVPLGKRLSGASHPHNLFASCSAMPDATICVWDSNSPNRPLFTLRNGHGSVDINVLAWNPIDPSFLASGGDDGVIRVWDITRLGGPLAEVATVAHHRGAINTLDWDPHGDGSVLCSADDNMLVVWDLGLEPDPEAPGPQAPSTIAPLGSNVAPVPQQVLFEHFGQSEVREARMHPQIPGFILSSAADGVHLFQPENMDASPPKVAVDGDGDVVMD